MNYSNVYEDYRKKKYFLVKKDTDNFSIYPLYNRTHSFYMKRVRFKIQQSIKNIVNPVFVTLTFKDDVDYKQSKKIFNSYITSLRRFYKKHNKLFQYVVVSELTKNDRIHFHICISNPYDNTIFHRRGRYWFTKETFKNLKKLFSWKYGFVDVVPVANAAGAAKYIVKYITKTFISQVNKWFIGMLIYHNLRFYTRSRNLSSGHRLDKVKNNSNIFVVLSHFKLQNFFKRIYFPYLYLFFEDVGYRKIEVSIDNSVYYFKNDGVIALSTAKS